MNDCSVKFEETISMSVQIQASPLPEVKWYKNNQLVQESDRVNILKESDDTYILVINGACLEDAGSYSIVAKNEINETSQFWDLTVKYPPRITKSLGEPQLIEEGSSLTLDIEVESKYTPTVTWIKEGEILQQDNRIRLFQESNKYSLRIDNLVDTDTASYKVEVSNKDGRQEDRTKVQVVNSYIIEFLTIFL